MGAQPSVPLQAHGRALPDYLPARMINEFVYCPRLFFYEQVEGVFVHSADTVEGAVQHNVLTKKGTPRPSLAKRAKSPRSFAR